MKNRDVLLVLNAGPSTLKFSVYQAGAGDWSLSARGQIDGLGMSPQFSARDEEGGRLAVPRLTDSVRDHSSALEALASWLPVRCPGAQVRGVGHRVVHGGSIFGAPVVVTHPVVEQLRRLVPLAPLHQPYNLAGIDAVARRMPGVPQVACFDTAFHRGRRDVVDIVPLPLEIRRVGVQRYGFHGLSYEYIASVLPRLAPDIAAKRVIISHLGSAASLCALNNGRSVDSSFGFTALDGLCMGTSPGALDPGIVLFMVQSLGLSPKEVETVLYQRSGLLGLSGITSDMRDLLASPYPAARVAVEYFVYRAAKEIGALATVLQGIDALVFTAGIGEHSTVIRARICQAFSWLGVVLDPAANAQHDLRISTDDSRVAVLVIPTNEDLMIARHTGALLNLDGVADTSSTVVRPHER